MNTDRLKKVEQKQLKDRPEFSVGDQISVYNLIREGEKSRTQVYTGVVLAIKGRGLSRTFTVRKISDGVGVEKIFPLHSPNVEKIEVKRRGRTRRSKLYYMRDRQGKAAMKVKAATEAKISKIESKEAEKAKKVEEEEKKKQAAKAEKKAKAEANKETKPKEQKENKGSDEDKSKKTVNNT
jgi:large subunit ribosomal protein L19